MSDFRPIASRIANSKNLVMGMNPSDVGDAVNFCRSRLRAEFRSVPSASLAGFAQTLGTFDYDLIAFRAEMTQSGQKKKITLMKTQTALTTLAAAPDK